MEEKEKIKYTSIEKNLKSKNSEKELEYENEIKIFENNSLNKILSKCTNLNKLSVKFIHELDSNSKNLQLNEFDIINKKKIYNRNFNKLSLNIEQNLLEFDKIYSLYNVKVNQI